VPLIRQEEVYPAANVPYAQAIEMVATAAVALNDIVVVDGVNGSIPKASPATAATAAGSDGQLFVALGAAALGAKFRAIPWRVVVGTSTTAVNTGGSTIGNPVYLSTGGDWSLTAGAEPRIVGVVLTVDSSLGKILLNPGQYVSRVVNRTISAAASTTTTLAATDSGKTVLMAPNAAIVVLPAPVVGMTFKIIQTGVFDTGASKVRTFTTDNSVFFVGGYAGGEADALGNLSDNNSNDVITFGSATVAGDYIEVTCITSTTWQANGFAQSGHDSNGMVFADT
jgi:hypothetical protein